MRQWLIIRVCTTFTFLFFLVMTGLSSAADQALIDAAKKEGEISIYTAFPRRFLSPTGELFKKMYGLGDDFEVRFSRKGTSALMQMVDAEHMAGRSNWDIVSHSDEGAFLTWIDKGVLMKYQPPNIDNFHEVFRDEFGYRVAHQVFLSSIGLHKKRVPEKDWPKSYEDVLDPKWKGRVGVMNPTTAGPGVMFTRFMVEVYGWDFFRKLGRTQPLMTKGCSALELLLLSGEIDLALCPAEFSVTQRIKAGETNLKLLYPGPTTGFFVMWIGINKDTPHPNAAKLWFEFSASDERNKLVTEIAGLYIPSKNVKLGTPRPDMEFHKVDWQWIKAHKNEMCKRFIEELEKGRAESR